MQGSYNEDPCIVIGPLSYHRLAMLLFDRTEHVIVGAPETKDDETFIDYITEHVARFGDRPRTNWIEIKPNVWKVDSIHGGWLSLFCPAWLTKEDPSQTEQPLVSLASIPIIDPGSISNDVIHEFRTDRASQLKLKRLRSFVHESYTGKPLSFIQDDLETRIADYRLAAQKWGLKTLESNFTISASEKLLSGACAGLISVLSGMPLAQAAAVGIAASLGTTTVKIYASRKRLQIEQAQDPISYIVDIQERSDTSNGTE